MGTQPESKLSRQIMELIRARGGFVFKVHGGPMTMNGVPDICGVYEGYSIWIETKQPGGVVSEIQRVRHAQIAQAGGVVTILRSVEEAREWLSGLSEE